MLVRILAAGIVAFFVTACAPVTAPDNAQPAEDSEEIAAVSSRAGEAATGEDQSSCTGALTSPNQEGPYYTPGSPLRPSLIEEGMEGTPILLRGGVYDVNCAPVAGAKVDFWQADAAGRYDNAGYTLRGHVVTDEEGRYSIETIEPGPYTGRPPHIHVKVFADDGSELLTTQMYFPGSEQSSDVRAAPDLFARDRLAGEDGRVLVRFDFVVQP